MSVYLCKETRAKGNLSPERLGVVLYSRLNVPWCGAVYLLVNDHNDHDSEQKVAVSIEVTQRPAGTSITLSLLRRRSSHL